MLFTGQLLFITGIIDRPTLDPVELGALRYAEPILRLLRLAILLVHNLGGCVPLRSGTRSCRNRVSTQTQKLGAVRVKEVQDLALVVDGVVVVLVRPDNQNNLTSLHTCHAHLNTMKL